VTQHFPPNIDLETALPELTTEFRTEWQSMMDESCHAHPVWESAFVLALQRGDLSLEKRFELAATWSINMVVGSYCFPRYVAALAARAPQDVVRHGLLENAWDESGGYGHISRSHFWLAVRLARLLGLGDQDLVSICPLRGAINYTTEHYTQCTAGDFGFALGMISLIEEFTTPEFTLICNTFLDSCESGLGIKPAEFILNGGAEYFTANIADDERHREEMPRIAAAFLAAEGVDLSNSRDIKLHLEQVKKGVRYSADLRATFFSDVFNYVESGRSYRNLSN
jgi:pyrroloquinoline quinone (PQQ) biosynthesis protein C